MRPLPDSADRMRRRYSHDASALEIHQPLRHARFSDGPSRAPWWFWSIAWLVVAFALSYSAAVAIGR